MVAVRAQVEAAGRTDASKPVTRRELTLGEPIERRVDQSARRQSSAAPERTVRARDRRYADGRRIL
ncbi:MAG: hypothetical protein ACREJ0_01060, partial [Geminicoccaceae bacterium]